MASGQADLRRLVALKRDALQARIDGLGQTQATLTRRIEALRGQGDGLAVGDVARGGFQLAAMAGNSARNTALQLEAERARVLAERRALVRERVSLDLADRKLDAAQKAQARLLDSRADLKG